MYPNLGLWQFEARYSLIFDNAIHVLRRKEKANLDAQEKKKQNDILRQQDTFQASKNNFKKNADKENKNRDNEIPRLVTTSGM